MKKKCCIKFKDEYWKSTRVKAGSKCYLTCKEKKGAIYAEVSDVEVDLNVV